jgi:hypothetical protein
MMKRNRGQMQDTWSSNCAAPVFTNVATAPPPSNHARMEQLEAILNNIISAPASTSGEDRNSEVYRTFLFQK